MKLLANVALALFVDALSAVLRFVAAGGNWLVLAVPRMCLNSKPCPRVWTLLYPFNLITRISDAAPAIDCCINEKQHVI